MTSGSDALNQASSAQASSPETVRPVRTRRLPLVPLLLALLALMDLRVELQLLFDHFTFTSLTEAIRNHLLAVSVLLCTPSLLRRYRF